MCLLVGLYACHPYPKFLTWPSSISNFKISSLIQMLPTTDNISIIMVLSLIVPPLNSVQFSSVAQSCPALCDPVNHSMLGLPVHHQLIFCRPLLLLPPIPPSLRVFSNESTLRIRWPKYWSFSLSISPSNEHPEMVSFRMDCLDLLAVQGTLKSFSNSNSHIHT